MPNVKLALILASALGMAPTAPETPVPLRVLIPQGQTFECTAPGGCFLANEAGIGEMVREIADQARSKACPKPGVSL